MAYGEGIYGEGAYGEDSAPPISVTGEKWAATTTALDGTPRVGLRVSGDPWSAAATVLDGIIPVTTPIVVTGDLWTASATVLDGSGRLRVAGDAWTGSADFVNGGIVGAPIVATGEPWAAAAAILDGIGFTPPPLNGFGLALDSTAVLTVDDVLEPDPVLPPGTPVTMQHITTPTVPVPVLVAGRPQ